MPSISIKRQLWLALALTLASLATIWAVDRYYQGRALQAFAARESLAILENEMLTLRRAEKDFLARKDLDYVARFEDTYGVYEKDIASLRDTMLDMGMTVDELDTVDDKFAEYRNSFQSVVAKQKRIGLHHEDGLYGALRSAAHSVEKTVSSYPELMASLLMLRRHEKDFMLRRLDKYAQRYMTTLSDFRGLLFMSDIDSQVLASTQSALKQYSGAFQDLIQAERDIGLDHESGLHGSMRSSIHEAEEAFASLRSRLDNRLDSYISDVTRLASALVLLMGALIAAILVWVIRDLSKSFGHAVGRARALADGDWDTPIVARRQDEVGELLRALDHMREEVLQRSMTLEADNKVKGLLAELGQVLQGVKETEQLAEQVVRFLTPLLNCQVGVLYSMEEGALHFRAGYGIESEDLRQRVFEPGDGLVGQVAINGDIMRVTDVPGGYLDVSSATGSAAPAEITLVPLLWNEQLFGVIELASLQLLDDGALHFIREAEEPIAVALNACQIRAEMSKVLEDAWDKNEQLEEQKAENEAARQHLQEQAHKLQASEEELRAQQEELQAQQEELRVTNEELESQARMFHDRTRELEEENRKLRKARP